MARIRNKGRKIASHLITGKKQSTSYYIPIQILTYKKGDSAEQPDSIFPVPCEYYRDIRRIRPVVPAIINEPGTSDVVTKLPRMSFIGYLVWDSSHTRAGTGVLQQMIQNYINE